MPWNFGQFESVALQAALYLLDELSQIAVTSRGNPALISRELSALVSDSSLQYQLVDILSRRSGWCNGLERSQQ